MIRILHVVTTMDFGGVETLLMNIYRSIDREEIQFDFLCMNTCANLFSSEIKKMGGKMYAVPFMSKVGYLGYLRRLYSFFKEHPEYKIVHSHINSYNGLVLGQAQKAGVPIRISHSHVSNIKGKSFLRKQIDQFCAKKIEKYSNIYFACSTDAAKELYHQKKNYEECIIMNNAINVEKFKFDLEQRLKIRKKYFCEDKFVIGHVGRFSYEKNQRMIIELAENILKNNVNIEFWLIGDGPDKKELEQYVLIHQMDKNIKFLGVQNNISALMSAMDMFLFPSIFEGLGIVAIEAQASGLPILSSDTVPQETKLTPLIQYLPLNDKERWVTSIFKIVEDKKSCKRQSYVEDIREKGYDIKDVSERLVKFYQNLVEIKDENPINMQKNW